MRTPIPKKRIPQFLSLIIELLSILKYDKLKGVTLTYSDRLLYRTVQFGVLRLLLSKHTKASCGPPRACCYIKTRAVGHGFDSGSALTVNRYTRLVDARLDLSWRLVAQGTNHGGRLLPRACH